MTRTAFAAALLAATALAAPASAQADTASEIAAMRAEIAALQAKVEALEAAAASASRPSTPAPVPVPVPVPAPAAQASMPAWRGAPTFTSEGGWSFKPRGRIQYDAGWVGRPDGVADRGLGFSNELRRLRLGAEGHIPGGFNYKFEVDFAESAVEIVDATVGYNAGGGFGLTLGQHNPFQSLEELTSSRFSSFIERAAFTDAFNFERRVGLSAAYAKGPLIANVGIFTDNVADLDEDDNNAIGVDGRIVFAPKMGDTQLHFGGSAHWRDNRDLAANGLTTRYRQRPLIHSTDVRFIGTPAIVVDRETSYGLEAAAIHGPFHAVAETHWLEADPLAPGGAKANFSGGYAEVGWYLTGETRGYRNGLFDRTRVLRPVGDGGFGAVQINLRYDHLDLNNGGLIGGKQTGYLASLIWIPQDYVRFMINYGRLAYDDATLPAAGGDRDYKVDVIGARAQIDF